MATPAIQTLLTDAQQVLNLNSLSEVRSTMAAALANANVGTPLNPNLTTQQLWNEFYLIVRQPESDIESIITNQLMKFLFAPPAPGGAGANHEVIYNNNGVLAGDPKFLWDDALNNLDIDGSATISGDLTVRTTGLKVTSSAVGIGTASPIAGSKLHVDGGFIYGTNTAGAGLILFRTTDPTTQAASPYIKTPVTSGYSADAVYGFWYQNCGISNPAFEALAITTNSSERYRIASDGVATWSNVGGVAGTAMTLNSTGLGIGIVASNSKLSVYGTGDQTDETATLSVGDTAAGGMRLYAGVNNTNEYVYIGSVKSGTGYRTLKLQPNGGNAIVCLSITPPTLTVAGDMVFNLTSNTNLRISVRGTDGTTRVANITLA
jgi:hypothetical protein